MTRKKIVAGNWKMNGSLETNERLLDGVLAEIESENALVIVAPPFTYLSQVSGLVKGTGVSLAAQNASQYLSGAYTGETSLTMLKDLSVEYVLVGHSERRTYYGETDHVVAEKTKAILESGLTPILCIGESLEERQAEQTLVVCANQINAVLNEIGVSSFAKVVVAYEPVWAIGTGLSATAQQAQDVHEFVRKHIATQNAEIAEKVQILYGGSVKANNSEELFSMPDIDGALVGGASLIVEEFVGIIKSAG
ncbi:triose-phosphate isomerase [Marinomonas algicola]|uniref:triose-phosphate isomerase n=1 Tax=Marinomonas algicola TaxID=2773454 RepID=UPI00174B9F74|nr:triose-phosphate isomerase [Marinomonas algicola]